MKEIGNDWSYFFDSKRFALWHRRSLPMSAKAIDIDLNAGEAEATVWTDDLTHEYVHINADYES